jgi:site-specific DNA recombinase
MSRRATPTPTPTPTPSEAKRCAIYTRKSTTAGLDQAFTSLDAQRESCLSYVQRQPGWALVDARYDDGGFTGANTDRPALQRLLADIATGRIDVVLVYKIDRLSRSLLDFVTVMERFNAANVAFVSVTQNFSTADAMGRLTMNMLMSFAEFEREMISERTRDKIRAARRKGQWTGGAVPLGYVVKKKKLVVDELEAILVREIFATYLARRSALAVVRALNEHKRVTKHGRPWTRNDVLRVLKHPVYAGYIASGGEHHEGEHSAIVERVVFARAQALLADNTMEKKDRGRNPEYLLRGVLHCACCGSAFTPASTTKGGAVYRYYRCVRRDTQGTEACASSPLPAGAIEEHVIERVREATADGELAADVARAVSRLVHTRRQEILVERQKLPPKIAALSDNLRRLVDTLTGLTGSARQHLDGRLHEVDAERARYEAQLVAADRDLASLDRNEVETTWVAACLADFDKVWDVLTLENRGRLVRAVIQRVEVDQPASQVRVFITDLGADVAGPTPTPELSHEQATA